MGVTGFLVEHGAQAEAEMRVEAGAADAALFERNRFGLAVFEEQLAIVHSGQAVPHDGFGGGPVEACASPVVK